MASQRRIVDYLMDQITGAGAVSARKMFGEYGVYCDGKMVALICDDQLFVKPTAGGRAKIGDTCEASPYPGAKPCFLIPGDRWEDREWLAQLIQVTATELSVSTKKAGRTMIR